MRLGLYLVQMLCTRLLDSISGGPWQAQDFVILYFAPALYLFEEMNFSLDSSVLHVKDVSSSIWLWTPVHPEVLIWSSQSCHCWLLMLWAAYIQGEPASLTVCWFNAPCQQEDGVQSGFGSVEFSCKGGGQLNYDSKATPNQVQVAESMRAEEFELVSSDDSDCWTLCTRIACSKHEVRATLVHMLCTRIVISV
jgi:hypothetical protein